MDQNSNNLGLSNLGGDGAHQAHPAEGMPEGWTQILVPRKAGNRKAGNVSKTWYSIQDKYWFSPKESYKFNAAVKVRRFLDVLDEVGGDEVHAHRLYLKKNRLYLKKSRSDGFENPKTFAASIMSEAPTIHAGSNERKKERVINATHAMKKTKPQETIVLPPGFRVPCGFVVVYEGSPVVPKKNPSEYSMTPSAIRSREWRERHKETQKKIREEEGLSTNRKNTNNTRRCSRTQT